MLTTSNYSLNKPEPTDVIDIDNFNSNFDTIDTQLKSISDKANYMQTAGGTSTAITLSNVTLADGFTVTFIAAYSNSGTATTINGKSLYKPGGTTAPTLIAGKGYSVWYNSTTGCFYISNNTDDIVVYTHPSSGVTAGTYHKVTVDTQGHVTAGSNTTIAISEGGTGATTAATALTNLGITSTAAELNALDGITATVTELNYTDGVISNIQTQLNDKAPSSAPTFSGASTFNGTISANNGIQTPNSSALATGIRVGDDAYLADINRGNMLGVISQTDTSTGGIVFGTSNDAYIYRSNTGSVSVSSNDNTGTSQLRNIYASTSAPSSLVNGEICLVYE